MQNKLRTLSPLAAAAIVAALSSLSGCTEEPVATTPLPELAVEPNVLDLNAPYGGPSPNFTFIHVSSSAGDELPYTFSEDSPWITLINQQGTYCDTTPDSFITSFRVWKGSDTLAVGTYLDSVTVASPQAGNSPQYIEITLTISIKMVVNPALLTFIAALEGEPQSNSFYVTSLDGSPFFYYADNSSSWLSLSGATGLAPERISANVDVAGLQAGSYLDTIIISSDNVANSPQVVICSLSVSPWLAQQSAYEWTLQGVSFADRMRGWAVGFLSGGTKTGHIIRTVDGGSTWELANLLPEDPSAGTALGDVEFIGDIGWVVGENGVILHTEDGGNSWEYQSSGLSDTAVTLNDVFFISRDTGWIVGDTGTVLKTTDGGETWSPLNSASPRNLLSVWFAHGANGWAVGDFGAILRTSDGGDTWTPQFAGLFDFRGVCFSNATTGWVVGKLGTILHTVNGGLSWSSQPSGVTSNLSAVFFISSSVGWAVGEQGRILHTSDGGSSWRRQFSDTDKWLFAVHFVDSVTGWVVGEDGEIRFTSSAGY